MPTLRFIGHSAFTLEGDGKSLLIDPFVSGNPVATISADDLNPTTILVTHGHDDHVGDAVAIAKRTGAPVISIVEVANMLAGQGAPKTVDPNYGGTAQFDGGSVKLVPAWHTSAHSSTGAVGQPAGMVVRFGGKTVYFAGDTSLFLDMQLIGDEELDVAVLPIGDHYTMGPKDAVRAVKFLRPRFVVPCHYNTFPALQQDAAAFKKQVEEETAAKVVILEPGSSWEIE
jgi:L-ascorbate metabolism protein UlaG (beta-lactamase superfamily)